MKSWCEGGLLVAALACAGCPRPAKAPPAARLVDVKVVDRSIGEERGAVDVAAIARRGVDDLGAARLWPIAVGAAPVSGVDYRLRIEVRVEVGESREGEVLRALVDARVVRIDGAPGETAIENRVLAERPFVKSSLPAREARAAVERAHLERAVDDALAGIAGRARLRLGATPELLAALGASDGELRAFAIQLAGERKDRATVPALIALIKSEDGDERDRAIGALIEIGDRRAVKPLTEAAHFRDVAELPKIIDAMAALGGEEARAWLEFVATGHGESEIRDLAREGLGRLDRRTPAATP